MLQWTADTFGLVGNLEKQEFFDHFNKTLTIMNRQVYPEDVANVMMWLVSEESRTITGQVFFVGGGQQGHMMPFDQQGR